MQNTKILNNKGFTIIEMIVSLGIFAVVAVIAVGALLKISDANKKALVLKTSINNLNFALETMSREMRLGSNFGCGQKPEDLEHGHMGNNCPNSGKWIISFDSQYVGIDSRDANSKCNLVYAYYFGSNSKLKKMQQKYCNDPIDDERYYYDIVSPDISIIDSNVEMDTSSQSRIFIWLKGSVGKREIDKVTFAVQTSISQRSPK